MRALFIAIGFICLAASAARAQGCGQYTSCQACVAQPQCGWCSSPVQYVNGSTGPQCAGFGAGATPFTCPDVYSTTTCVSGYNCDSSSGTCALAPPGQGGTLAQCTANCRKNGQPVYACDDATKTCSEVPSGTPGSSSLEICLAVCSGSPTPSPGPVAPVYACSTNFTCVPTTPGHGASKLVCEQQCNASNVLYLCSYTNGSCVQVPPLTPNGVPQAQCEQECSNVTPAPVPPAPSPPPEMVGVWRGVEIQNGYAILEFDALINNTYAAFSFTTTAAQTVFSGTPYHIPGSPTLEMWVVINDGPGAGLTVRMIADTSGERGPETEFATMAMGTPGGPTPASLVAAMNDGQSKVFALSKCIVNEQFCVFSFNGGSGATEQAAHSSSSSSATRRLRNRLMRARPQIEARNDDDVAAVVSAAATKKAAKAATKENVGFTDRCTTYDQACSVCVAAGCGWCSVDVQYVLPNGTQQTGTQCAGTGGTPFTCGGFYTTSTCEVGYVCDRTASGQSCVATVPGDGMPYDVCLQVCVATPPPAPRPPQYTCNLTTKTCAYCPSGACPGSMPQAQCESLCPNPYPGPTPDLLGNWRGIQSNQKYTPGEFDFVMAPTGVTVYKDGVFFYNATIISLGSDVMIWTVASGTGAGSTLGVLYQMAMQSPAPDGTIITNRRAAAMKNVGVTGFYWQMTMAIAPNSAPTEFDTPMFTDGDQEFVLAQCLKEPCVFNTV